MVLLHVGVSVSQIPLYCRSYYWYNAKNIAPFYLVSAWQYLYIYKSISSANFYTVNLFLLENCQSVFIILLLLKAKYSFCDTIKILL